MRRLRAITHRRRPHDPDKLTTPKLELLIADHFGTRTNIIVPNVSWGLINHEADLLVLRPSKWAEEVELKISKADLKRDQEKNGGAGHRVSKLIHKLWFAVPEELADMPEIPAHAGIIKAVFDPARHYWRTVTVRAPMLIKGTRKLTDDEIYQLMRLGMFRVWSLKQKQLECRSSLDAAWQRARELEDGMAGSQGKA